MNLCLLDQNPKRLRESGGREKDEKESHGSLVLEEGPGRQMIFPYINSSLLRRRRRRERYIDGSFMSEGSVQKEREREKERIFNFNEEKKSTLNMKCSI